MGTYIINDRYEVLAQIGRGGMGVVFRANQRSLNRIVAIKMLSRELAADAEFRQRFQQEAQVIARLQHENIVTVYDIESDRGTFFIIMEFVEGVSLQELLRTGRRLAPERAARLVAQVARALGYAHNKGIIHRDIKPDNIMVVDDEQKAMVMDFGIARVADSTLKTQTGVSMGTPKYMSPEQARGQHVDARSDLYSLGVVLYACATGELPFDGDSPFTVALKHMQEPPPPPREKAPDLPQALEDIILKALCKERNGRFQTGEEFATALEEIFKPAMIPAMAGIGATVQGIAPEVIAPMVAIAAEELPDPSVMTPTPLPSWTPKKKQNNHRMLWMGGGIAAIGAAALFVLFNAGPGNHDGQSTAVAAVSVRPVAPSPSPIPPSPTPQKIISRPQTTAAATPETLTAEQAFDAAGQILDSYRGQTSYEPAFVNAQRKKLALIIRTFTHLQQKAQTNPAMGVVAIKIGRRLTELYRQLPPEQAQALFGGLEEYITDDGKVVWQGFRGRELDRMQPQGAPTQGGPIITPRSATPPMRPRLRQEPRK